MLKEYYILEMHFIFNTLSSVSWVCVILFLATSLLSMQV